MKKTYIKHGPIGLNKTIDTVDSFIEFVKALEVVDATEGAQWEFEVVKMTEKEYGDLPEFEGF